MAITTKVSTKGGKKTRTKKTKKVETEVSVEAPVKVSKPKAAKKTKSETKPKAAKKTTKPKAAKKAKVEAKVETKVEAKVETKKVETKKVEAKVKVEEEKTVGTRSKPTKEFINLEFDSIIQYCMDEITSLRENPKAKASSNIKSFRKIASKLKQLKTTSNRLIKDKKPSNRKSNANSGFNKPVKISDEMAKFNGWGDELHSRVDVTKAICAYVSENNLQNPDDRRQILPDDKLKKLLSYNGTEEEPLTYYRIQQYIKHHFV